jgi:arsenate reductase (thioredoxin)
VEEIEVTIGSVDDARRLLRAAELPVEDLDGDRVEILVARDGVEIVGCVGIEHYGTQTLLRSLAVERGHQRSGIGTALVRSALEGARRAGTLDAYCVTTDASGYLALFGFEEIERAALAGEIVRSSELGGVCPDDAAVMWLSLRPVVLFMCVHNAGRSQMAAAWLAHRAGDRVVVASAGSEPATAINPVVVEAMREVGIDLSREVPKPMTIEMARMADVVVTMGCGDACPVFPGKRYLDWDLPDPAGRSLEGIRSIRTEIQQRVDGLVAALGICR